MSQLLASEIEHDDPQAIPKTLGFPALPCPSLSIPDAAYLAGIVDGEGSVVVQVGGGQITAYVLVANTSAALMDWLYEHVGGYVRKATAGRLATIRSVKPMYRWQIGGGNALTLLGQLGRRLVIKAQQADAAIAAISAWRDHDIPSALGHAQVVRRLNNSRARKYWKAKRGETTSRTTG